MTLSQKERGLCFGGQSHLEIVDLYLNTTAVIIKSVLCSSQDYYSLYSHTEHHFNTLSRNLNLKRTGFLVLLKVSSSCLLMTFFLATVTSALLNRDQTYIQI